MNSNSKGSASKIKIVSFNANSIGRNPKRGNVFHFLKKKQPDIVVIIDTRICIDIENSVREEWGGKALFSSHNSQSRGVGIFLKKDSLVTFLDHSKDPSGNLLSVLMEYEGKKILLEGIYGPNLDSQTFYQE